MILAISTRSCPLFDGTLLEVELPGDYNADDVVDAADYTLWRDNLGSGVSLPNDDTAGIGPDDYTRWKLYFGQTTGAGAGGNVNVAVPEPATMLLLILAAISIRFRCRHIA
jgi:hypothetical protein